MRRRSNGSYQHYHTPLSLNLASNNRRRHSLMLRGSGSFVNRFRRNDSTLSELVVTSAEPAARESECRTDYGAGFSQDCWATKTHGLTSATGRSCRYLEEGWSVVEEEFVTVMFFQEGWSGWVDWSRNGECDSLPLSISDSQVHIANTTRSAMVWISEGRSDIEGGLKACRTVQVSDLSPDSWLIFRPLLCLCYEFFFVELVLAGCGLLRMAPVRTRFLLRLSLSWSASPSFSALSLYFFLSWALIWVC